MGHESKDAGKTTSPAVDTKSQSVADELDLDKNPIKYATHIPGEMTTDAHDKDYMELTLRSGKHSELVQKLLRQRIEMRAKEFPRWPGDTKSGVRAMWIESRFWYDRERLGPDFDDDWRSYRARYLHSLELDPREPVHVPEFEKALLNPIRRFYMKAGDLLEYKVLRRFSDDKYKTATGRFVITRGLMAWFGFIGLYYYIRYNSKKWETNKGPDLYVSRPIMYPDHPRYPFKDWKTEPSHHYNVGFSRRNVYKDLRDWEDTTVIL